jgi:transcriptional regulator with XRE-family HTH domain
MSRKALFADLQADLPDFKADLAKVAVAADLSVLLAQANCTRADLAKRLGWSRARVTQVLSGEGNLTIETVFAVAHALGHRFDVVFRKPDERRQPQAWERGVVMSMGDGTNVLQFSGKSAMADGRRSRKPVWQQATSLQQVFREEVGRDDVQVESLNAA